MFHRFQPRFDNLSIGFLKAHVLLFGVVFHAPVQRVRNVDFLSERWSARVNEKTHRFRAYRSFIDRLATTAEEYGSTVEIESEAYTTAECPVCGERDDTERDGDVYRCSCGYEDHADLDASRTFLERQVGENAVGSMARPVRLTWDDHDWLEIPHSPERASPNEERTNRRTGDGKLASVSGWPTSPPEESHP